MLGMTDDLFSYAPPAPTVVRAEPLGPRKPPITAAGLRFGRIRDGLQMK